jgi:hypothetical protein
MANEIITDVVIIFFLQIYCEGSYPQIGKITYMGEPGYQGSNNNYHNNPPNYHQSSNYQQTVPSGPVEPGYQGSNNNYHYNPPNYHQSYNYQQTVPSGPAINVQCPAAQPTRIHVKPGCSGKPKINVIPPNNPSPVTVQCPNTAGSQIVVRGADTPKPIISVDTHTCVSIIYQFIND